MQASKKIDLNWNSTILLILLAYLFSIAARMYWPWHFSGNEAMYFDGTLMINTNDGYFFASGAKDILDGSISVDAQRVSAQRFGLTTFTAYITKFSGFSLENITLYLSAVISSLVVIPIVLVSRLMGHATLGFFAALIGSIAWSYYNRTMVGYYDSDMFAIFLQFSIFYAFMHIAYKKDLLGILLAIPIILVYPYFYPQGISVTYAMFIMLVVYLVMESYAGFKNNETESFIGKPISLFGTIILLSISLMTTLPIWLRVLLVVAGMGLFYRSKLTDKQLMYMSMAAFVGFLYFGNFFHVLTYKMLTYLGRDTASEGLMFYQVVQTVREAGEIPMSTIANRISGSSVGLLLSFIGFIVLVLRHKPFIIALPLIGVGLFAYVGGLRFTVYAVPIAAVSAVYLFWILGSYFSNKRIQYSFVFLGTLLMLYPNIQHIIGYKVPTVLNKAEVNDLATLKKISSRKDYTLSWWDYGYPIWYYSNTSTLIDGGKHQNDNFIISKIMQTTSATLAVNLSRVAVETYVDSNYSVVANVLFKNKEKNQVDPSLYLYELEDTEYVLPKKTRDIYLYLPYKMLGIFPTVAIFGNLDLKTGKAKRNIAFYPSTVVNVNDGNVFLRNGIVFDSKKGVLKIGAKTVEVRNFITTQNTKDGTVNLQPHIYNINGQYAVINMKSYGRFVVMDIETFKSMYVQMFILGIYDKNLFELVVSSAYSKIYKLKR